jgi:UrcA family protein
MRQRNRSKDSLYETTDLPIPNEPIPTIQEMTMKTLTQTIKLQRMTATVLFSALALSFAAMCPAGDTTGANQSTVKYADLNVSSPAGAAALYARINGAANGVCWALDGRDLASKTNFNRCVHKGISDAVTKVDRPALYSIYNAKNSTQKPIMLASGLNR